MKPLARWWRFNLVGAMGYAVQLVTLTLFNRWSAGHYLLAAAAAIELTLLHNFTWHLHLTWRDRHEPSTLLTRLLRFHLSNGVVSLTGNLILMRLLVQAAHLPLLLANSIAILCCSLVNFILGDRWSFAGSPACLPRPSSGSGILRPSASTQIPQSASSLNPGEPI